MSTGAPLILDTSPVCPQKLHPSLHKSEIECGSIVRRCSDLLPNVAAQIGWIYQAVIGNATTRPTNNHVTACQRHRITSNIDGFGLTAVIPLLYLSIAISIVYCRCIVCTERVMTIERRPSTSKRELAASPIVLPGYSVHAFLLARTGGIVSSQRPIRSSACSADPWAAPSWSRYRGTGAHHHPD